MTIILFFYGLTFIFMGIAIFTIPKRHDVLDISKDLWPIGLFGFLHGLNEWADLFIFRGGPIDVGVLDSIANLLLPISFIFLIVFSARILCRYYRKLRWIKYLWAVCLAVWAVSYIFSRDYTLSGIVARYFICIPGTFLSALGLYTACAKKEIRQLPLTVVAGFCVTIASLVVYGILSGLVVPKANFLFAKVINYQSFISVFGLPVQLFRMFLAIAISAGIIAITGIFSYEGGRVRLRGGIRRKITSFISMAILSVILIGFLTGYFSGFKLLNKLIGVDHERIANILASNIRQRLEEEVSYVKGLVSTEALKNVIRESNARYQKMDPADIRKFMTEMDERWISSGNDSPILKEYLETGTSLDLNNSLVANEQMSEIFISDRFGGLVASSGRTTDFYQADESWWQHAFANGRGEIFIEDIEFDESSGVLGLTLALPIKDDDGSVIGVLKSILNIASLFSFLGDFKLEHTGHASLINKNGYIITHEEIKPLTSKALSDSDFQKLLRSKARSIITDISNVDKKKLFVSFALVNYPTLLNEGIIWRVLVEQDNEEAFQPMYRLMFQAVVVGLVSLILIPLFGSVFGIRLSLPIEKLKAASEHIARGELDYPITVKSGDELEDLANSMKEIAISIKNREGLLVTQKIFLESVFTSMTDCVIVLNPDANIVSVNTATLDLLDYEQSELVGLPLTDIVAEGIGGGKEDIPKYIDKTKINGVTYNMGLTLRTKLGGVVPVNMGAAVMRDAENITGIVCVAKDMRHIMAIMKDLVQAKVGLETANKELQAALRAKAEFTEMVSHELRTPLAAIQEGINLVVDGMVGSVNEEQKTYLGIARGNVDRLGRLINGILSIQRLESGEMEFEMKENDINVLIKEVQQLMLPAARKKNLELVIQPDESLHGVKCDRDKIAQVLANLTNNAIKFTERGGITIASSREDDSIHVTVKDTGPGIKKEDFPKLFQKFSQLRRSTSGAGLGLSICKSIVKAHKGKIWVESKFGDGSAFHFTLPSW